METVQVLIVAKCIVNKRLAKELGIVVKVFIVAKCIVNVKKTDCVGLYSTY